MRCKIMTVGSLEDTLGRLAGARALVCVLAEHSSTSVTPEDALNGAADLLEAICRDFQAERRARHEIPQGRLVLPRQSVRHVP